MEYGKYVGLHRDDAINIDLWIYKLQEHTGDKTAFCVTVLQIASAFEGMPGQIEHIDAANNQHNRHGLWNQGGQKCAE